MGSVDRYIIASEMWAAIFNYMQIYSVPVNFWVESLSYSTSCTAKGKWLFKCPLKVRWGGFRKGVLGGKALGKGT
jgi:hypothetical protein